MPHLHRRYDYKHRRAPSPVYSDVTSSAVQTTSASSLDYSSQTDSYTGYSSSSSDTDSAATTVAYSSSSSSDSSGTYDYRQYNHGKHNKYGRRWYYYPTTDESSTLSQVSSWYDSEEEQFNDVEYGGVEGEDWEAGEEYEYGDGEHGMEYNDNNNEKTYGTERAMRNYYRDTYPGARYEYPEEDYDGYEEEDYNEEDGHYPAPVNEVAKVEKEAQQYKPKVKEVQYKPKEKARVDTKASNENNNVNDEAIEVEADNNEVEEGEEEEEYDEDEDDNDDDEDLEDDDDDDDEEEEDDEDNDDDDEDGDEDNDEDQDEEDNDEDYAAEDYDDEDNEAEDYDEADNVDDDDEAVYDENDENDDEEEGNEDENFDTSRRRRKSQSKGKKTSKDRRSKKSASSKRRSNKSGDRESRKRESQSKKRKEKSGLDSSKSKYRERSKSHQHHQSSKSRRRHSKRDRSSHESRKRDKEHHRHDSKRRAERRNRGGRKASWASRKHRSKSKQERHHRDLNYDPERRSSRSTNRQRRYSNTNANNDHKNWNSNNEKGIRPGKASYRKRDGRSHSRSKKGADKSSLKDRLKSEIWKDSTDKELLRNERRPCSDTSIDRRVQTNIIFPVKSEPQPIPRRPLIQPSVGHTPSASAVASKTKRSQSVTKALDKSKDIVKPGDVVRIDASAVLLPNGGYEIMDVKIDDAKPVETNRRTHNRIRTVERRRSVGRRSSSKDPTKPLTKTLAELSSAGNPSLEHLESIGLFVCGMRQQNYLTDISIRVSSTTIPAHRLILCRFSEYFAARLLTETRWRSDHIVDLEFPIDTETFNIVLDFMYTGHIDPNLSDPVVVQILFASLDLGVLELRQVCERQLDHLQTPQILQLLAAAAARGLDHEKLLVKQWRHLTNDFASVLTCTEFLHLDFSLARKILGRPDLQIRSEWDVLTAAERWINADQTSRSQYAVSLLDCVQFRNFNQSELVQLSQRRDPIFADAKVQSAIVDANWFLTCQREIQH